MPVSKKKVYKERQFTNTSGYRKNAHRDKSGKTLKEREQERFDRQRNREIRNRVEAEFAEHQILKTIKDMGELVLRKEEK